MVFEKKGRIFIPQGQRSWMQHHSQVPTLLMRPEGLRIFFTTRHLPEGDKMIVSNTGYIDVAPNDPGNILNLSEEPVLPLGGPGTFDEFGIMPGCVIKVGHLHYFYYTGWTRTHTVPHTTSIGLAVSSDGGNTFSKMGEGPLFSRTFSEPFLENGPYILEHEGIYHMWYSSGTKWILHNDKYESVYVIMHATSTDGISWVREGKPCIQLSSPNEAQNRPSVIKLGDTFHMWFCSRAGIDFRGTTHGYRMGYATSEDLVTWKRDDSKARITLSENGWDSEMQAYPDLIKIGDELVMFYNGNAFGREGIGFAKAKLADFE